MKILLVSDDSDVLASTSDTLKRDGFTVLTARDGPQAFQRWQADQPDLIVLEADLPGLSGFEVCRQIRASDSTPVILLSAQTADAQVVEGFRAGADAFLAKPFSPQELNARIRAIQRRFPPPGAHLSRVEVRVDSLRLVLESETHEVYQGSHRIHLTSLEFRLLYQLASNAGRVVPVQRLVESVWGYDTYDTSLLKTHMTHIRKKLQLPRQGPGSLTAVPGVGYRLQR